jgi:hypothetical protein
MLYYHFNRDRLEVLTEPPVYLSRVPNPEECDHKYMRYLPSDYEFGQHKLKRPVSSGYVTSQLSQELFPIISHTFRAFPYKVGGVMALGPSYSYFPAPTI